MAEMKKSEGEGTVTRFQAENVAIKSLEQGGFTQEQIRGDAEVKNLVEEFGRNYENQPRKEVEEAAKELYAKWEKQNTMDFTQPEVAEHKTEEGLDITPLKVEVAKLDLKTEGPEEERKPERIKPLPAPRTGELITDEVPVAPMEREKPDTSLAQAEIEAKKQKAAEMKALSEETGLTGQELALAYRRREIEGRTGEIRPVSEAETMLAKNEGEKKVFEEGGEKRREEVAAFNDWLAEHGLEASDHTLKQFKKLHAESAEVAKKEEEMDFTKPGESVEVAVKPQSSEAIEAEALKSLKEMVEFERDHTVKDFQNKYSQENLSRVATSLGFDNSYLAKQFRNSEEIRKYVDSGLAGGTEAVVAQRDKIVPVEEVPGEEEGMVFTEEEAFTPKDLLEVAFDEQGVDYKGFREKYADVMKKVEGTSDPGEIAAANEEAAELTRKSLEQIRGVESGIRKKFEGREDVLAELNSRIGKIEGTVESSLARAAEYRAKIEEAPPVDMDFTKEEVKVAAAVEAPKKTDEEAQRLVDIIQRNQRDAAAEAAARKAPAEEVAKVEPEKKKEPAKAPGPEKVAQAEKDIYHPKEEKREEAMAILQEDAKRREAAPEVVAQAPETKVEEKPAEVAAAPETKDERRKREILSKIKFKTPEIKIGLEKTESKEEEEARLAELRGQVEGKGVKTEEERIARGPAEGKRGEVAEIEQLRLTGGDADVKTGGAEEEKKVAMDVPQKKARTEEAGVTIAQLQRDADSLGKDLERLEKLEANLNEEQARWDSIENKDSPAALESSGNIGRIRKKITTINKTITQFSANYATVEAQGSDMTKGATVGEHSGRAEISRHNPAEVMNRIKKREQG
jgi:hypothetical protein